MSNLQAISIYTPFWYESTVTGATISEQWGAPAHTENRSFSTLCHSVLGLHPDPLNSVMEAEI